MENNFDVIIIGSGPGGYVCAIRCAQLGLKTACVESRKTLGGTCLNVGCIPSKSLLNLSETYQKAKKEFSKLGIETSEIKLNLSKMMQNKNKSILTLTKGVEFLLKKNKITHLKGKGLITSNNTVTVTDTSKKKIKYKAKNIVISTGSIPATLSGIEIDEKIVVSSTGALSFENVPKELVIIGGGYIGLEMGSVWKRLGSNVTVIEFLDSIIPEMDNDISNEFLKILKKQGINFKLESEVTSVNKIKNQAVVDFTNSKTKKRDRIQCDKVLIAVGRKPNINSDIKNMGIKLDSQKKIEVNNKFETNIKNIYGIKIEGDLCPVCRHRLLEDFGGDYMKLPVKESTFSVRGRRGVGVVPPMDANTQDTSLLIGSEDISKLDLYPEETVSLTSNETGRRTTRPLSEVLRERYAEITAMDRSIGHLRTHLSKQGIRNNALLWYCGDNGSPQEGMVVSKLRGGKGRVYEGGTRVPGVIE